MKNISSHDKAVHQIALTKCELCPKSFSNKQKVANHVRRSHKKVWIKCDICKKDVAKDRIMTHKKIHTADKDGKIYKCDFCTKTFPTMAYLRQHIRRIHSEQKRFQCDICYKYYPSNSGLKVHIRNEHEERKLYTCDICEVSVGSIAYLKRHYANIHDRIPKKSCNICLKLVRDLTSHQRFEHTKGESKCELCSKVFKNRHYLSKHISRAHKK